MKILNQQFNLDDFFNNIHKGSLLMMDYDGTLAPLKKERMQAYPFKGIKERLFSLSALKNTKTIIVSGRKLSELEILLSEHKHLELWGSHGLERKLSNGKKIQFSLNKDMSKGLKIGKEICKENTSKKNYELKPYAIALHWRGLDENEKNKIKSTIEKMWKLDCVNYGLDVFPFDGGIELRPINQNKGNVVETILKEECNVPVIAYFGDDLTDEDAFNTLGNKGLKILVREKLRPTSADIHLIPPEELLFFLDNWITQAKNE